MNIRMEQKTIPNNGRRKWKTQGNYVVAKGNRMSCLQYEQHTYAICELYFIVDCK